MPGDRELQPSLGRAQAGGPPFTLYDFFPKDALMFVDESHVTVPQIHAMYHGDHAAARRRWSNTDSACRVPSTTGPSNSTNGGPKSCKRCSSPPLPPTVTGTDRGECRRAGDPAHGTG